MTARETGAVVSGSQVGYQKISEDKADTKPKVGALVGVLTSETLRLGVLIFAAHILTGLANTWLTITAVHLTGSEIQDDDGVMGSIYDVARQHSKITLATAQGVKMFMSTSKSNSTSGNTSFGMLPDDEVAIVKSPEDILSDCWQANLVHGWMVVLTLFSTILALGTWFVVLKNLVVDLCGVKRWRPTQTERENRQALASLIGLLWQFLCPAIGWIIDQIAHTSTLGVAPKLYWNAMYLGTVVMVLQKGLVILQAKLRDALNELHERADLAWTVCENPKTRNSTIQSCAQAIFESAHFFPVGSRKLKRGMAAWLILAAFPEKPYGALLGILGYVDKRVLEQVGAQVAEKVASWIKGPLNKMIERLQDVEAKLDDENSAFNTKLMEIKDAMQKVKHLLDLAVLDLNGAEEIAQRCKQLLGNEMSPQVENMIKSVRTNAVEPIDNDCKKILGLITSIEKEVFTKKEELKAQVGKLIKELECFSPDKLMFKLEGYAEKAIYQAFVDQMAKSKKDGALPLELKPKGLGEP